MGQCESSVAVGGIAREPAGGPVHADDNGTVQEIGRRPMEHWMEPSVSSTVVASEPSQVVRSGTAAPDDTKRLHK